MWIEATRKKDGVVEAINLNHVSRIYVNMDKDPETMIYFNGGPLVGYKEPYEYFMKAFFEKRMR